jgi:Rrf2 family transcriptional regulator, cysteine metabolism repressor
MKLSLYSEYALLTLIHLARCEENIPAAEIAAAQHIPAEMLTEILFALGQAQYVQQVAGHIGLAKSADVISAAEIIRLFDGALAPLEPVSSKGYGAAPMDREAKLSGLFENIQGEIMARLESASISVLA